MPPRRHPQGVGMNKNRRLRNEFASMQHAHSEWQNHLGGEMGDFLRRQGIQLRMRREHGNTKEYMYELQGDRINARSTRPSFVCGRRRVVLQRTKTVPTDITLGRLQSNTPAFSYIEARQIRRTRSWSSGCGIMRHMALMQQGQPHISRSLRSSGSICRVRHRSHAVGKERLETAEVRLEFGRAKSHEDTGGISARCGWSSCAGVVA